MAPGASVTYSCSLANVTASFTNTAVATGTPPSGSDVTASDTAHVTVTTPAPPVVETPKAPLTPPKVKVTAPGDLDHEEPELADCRERRHRDLHDQGHEHR